MIPSGFAGVIPFVREMENMMAEGERLMLKIWVVPLNT